MKTAAPIILVLTGLTSLLSAQNIQIRVDNTEPRLGQEINLTVEILFFEEFLKGALSDNLELKPTHSNMMRATIIPKQLGPTTIGPLEFQFNGVTYLSNSISINVIPNLTDKEGVWVRKLRMDDKDFVVVEQITTLKPKTKGSSTEWKPVEDNLVKLIEAPAGKHIEFFEGRSVMGGHPDKSKGYPPSISYSCKVYSVKKQPGFAGDFRLEEKYFENLPRGTRIPEIVID